MYKHNALMKPGIRFEISWTLKANTRDEKFSCFLYKQGLKKIHCQHRGVHISVLRTMELLELKFYN